jgi:signal transduction histidine kinase
MAPPGLALRAAYDAESRTLCAQVAEVSCWIGLPLIAIFGVLEWRRLIEVPALFPWLRVGCGAVIVMVLTLLRTAAGRRHARGLFAVVIGAIGLMLILMTLSTGREESPYLVGVALVLLAAAVLMPWPAHWSGGTAVGLLAAYAVATLASGPVANTRLFVSNCALLGATGLLVVASSAFRERLRWREFRHRTALLEALQHRRDFMAKMSHELRTPLHVIIGYADILLEDCLVPEAVEARALVDRSRSAAVSLHRMICDLLDYAKVEAGKMDIRPEPIHVPDVLTDLAARFQPIAARKGLALELTCANDLPRVASDRQRLEQILVNLVGNALKFTETGGVSIEAHGGDDGQAAALDGFRFLDGGGDDPALLGGYLAILVHDTGVGIQEHDLERLAEDFQQVDEAATGRYGGTGLGLSISRKLAQLIGGRIAIRSRYAGGSTFALLLPATPAVRHAAA